MRLVRMQHVFHKRLPSCPSNRIDATGICSRGELPATPASAPTLSATSGAAIRISSASAAAIRISSAPTIRTTSASAIRISSSASPTIRLQALLPAGAIGAGIPALAVVAEGAFPGTRVCLLSVAPLRLALILIEIVGASLVLIQSRAILLVEVALVAGRALLSLISPIFVSKLRLIVLLAEMRRSVIAGPAIVVEIVAVDVVGIHVVTVEIIGVDVVAVDVVAVDVVCIDVVHVAAVVIVAIGEGVGVRNVGVVVVDHGGVVPTTPP
jgi:hypothetical protein